MKDGIKILIVEDCNVMQSVIKKTLSLIGLPFSRIDSATNGLLGLQMIEKQLYDIIIVDLNMPVMDGMEMINNLKKYTHAVDTSVIVVSADGQQWKKELFKVQDVGFMHKPFKPEELRSKILEVTSTTKNS